MHDIDLTYFLKAFKRRFVFFLIPFVAILGCSLAIAKLWPRIYESTATILVESQRIPGDLVRSTVTAVADERIQVIKQRVRARDNMLMIMRKYDLFPTRRKDLGWSQSELIKLMKGRTTIERVAVSPGRSRRHIPTIAFTVSFKYENPAVAARVANELVTFILSEDVRARTSRASETTSFIEKEADRLAKQLSATEIQLSELKTKFKDTLPSTLQFNLLALERTQKALSDVDQSIGKAELKRRLAQSPISGIGGDATLDNQLGKLKVLLAQKQAIFSNAHPEIRQLRQQITALEGQNNVALPDGRSRGDPKPKAGGDQATSTINSRQMTVINAELAALRAKRAALAKTIARLKRNIDNTPQVELALTGLLRQYETLKKEYAEIRSKQSGAELGKKLEENKQAERFEVIEQATPPSKPIKPNRLLIVAMGLFAAIAAGGGGVVLTELLDNTIRTKRALLEAFDAAPIATIPHIRRQDDVRRTGVKAFAATAGALGVGAVALVAIDRIYRPIPLFFRDALKILLKFSG